MWAADLGGGKHGFPKTSADSALPKPNPHEDIGGACVASLQGPWGLVFRAGSFRPAFLKAQHPCAPAFVMNWLTWHFSSFSNVHVLSLGSCSDPLQATPRVCRLRNPYMGHGQGPRLRPGIFLSAGSPFRALCSNGSVCMWLTVRNAWEISRGLSFRVSRTRAWASRLGVQNYR